MDTAKVNKRDKDLMTKLREARKKQQLEAKKLKAKRVKDAISKESDIITFGNLITAPYADRYYGFVYRITLIYAGGYLVYTGSKTLNARSKWQTYTSSSEKVCNLIQASRRNPNAIAVRYEVLSYHTGKLQMLHAETNAILASVKEHGLDHVANVRTAHGVSLRTGKMIK